MFLNSIIPCWDEYYDKKTFEKELGIEFHGPGFYHLEDTKEFLIVYPQENVPLSVTGPSIPAPWYNHEKYIKDQTFHVCKYSSSPSENILFYLSTIPTREVKQQH